jgi:RNA polymerase-binding transcription factor DksA
MDVEKYKRKLLEIEASLSRRTSRLRADALDQVLDSPGDEADASVSDLGESEALAEAELDAPTLREVRDALQRIDNGTFGLCVVDNRPIEEKRLEAVPWSPFCAEHAQQREAATRRPTPTL